MEWVEAFLHAQRAWIEDAKRHGMPELVLQFGEQLLVELEAAKRTAEAEQFSVAEGSAITGLHPETIRRYLRQGKIGAHAPGKHQTLTGSDIAQLMSSRRRGGRTLTLVDQFKR